MFPSLGLYIIGEKVDIKQAIIGRDIEKLKFYLIKLSFMHSSLPLLPIFPSMLLFLYIFVHDILERLKVGRLYAVTRVIWQIKVIQVYLDLFLKFV